jgi:hypothetical protein
MNPIEKVFLPIANFYKTNLLIFYYSYLQQKTLQISNLLILLPN